MSRSPLYDIWEAAASQPYEPSVSKESQFTLAFALLLSALILTGLFGLSNKTVAALPIYGIPASLAFGFGSVFMICAVGVYV